MEEILLQNSKNITSLINLMKVHEENIKRFKMEPSQDDVTMKQTFYMESEYSGLSTSVKTCPMTRTCFSPNDIVILVRECGHVFKKAPFLDWLAYHSTCPRCNARLA